MKLSKCIRGMKLTIIILAALSLPMMNLPLLAEEPNQSDTDSIEQAVEAVTELRARAKAIKDRIEADLRDRKAQHKREREDITRVDQNELRQAKRRLALTKEAIKEFKKVRLALMKKAIKEFKKVPDNNIVRMKVPKRTILSREFNDGETVSVTIYPDSLGESLKRAKEDLRNARAKIVPAEIKKSQRDELREYGLIKKQVDSLDKELRRTLAALKRAGAIPQEFDDKLQKLNELVEETEADIAKKSAIIQAKYGHITKTKDDVDIEEAIARVQLGRAKLILQKDPALVNRLDGEGRSTLHQAVRKDAGNAMLGLLIDKGADVNAKDKYGRTPLHWAASSGLKNTLEFLIAKGADVNAKDKYGETPLDVVISVEQDNLAELLRKHGAVSGEEDEQGDEQKQ